LIFHGKAFDKASDRAEPNTRGRDLIVLIILVSALFGFMLGSRPLSVPDEGRYVEIPREMVATGNWLTPRLNGVKYFEKPPLVYWCEAFLIKFFGLSEWSVRLGPALFALFGCLVIYYAGTRLYGRRSGLISAVVLATSLLYYGLGRGITPDMPVSVLLTAALLSFLLGTREPEGTSRRLFFWAFYAFAALAVLSKGLIGIVIPGMIIVTWMLVMNEWRVLRSMHVLSGMIIFFAIAAPWHILVQRSNPEFFRFYFIHEHFERYLTNVHGRYKPFWFFIPIVLFGLFPWSAFLVQAVKHRLPSSWKDRRAATETIFLLLWAGIVFLFFSASSSKLVPYILPVLPPLALLIGNYLAGMWERNDAPGIHAGYVLLITLSLLMTAGLVILPHVRAEIDLHGLRPHIYALSGFLVASTLFIVLRYRGSYFKNVFLALTVCMSVFLAASNTVMPHVDTRSVKQLALGLKPRLLPGDDIASYRTYYQDLPVYLERRITVVDWAGELNFGTTVEDTSGWMISEAAFWKRWEGPGRVYAVTTRQLFNELKKTPGRKHFVIAEDKNNVILSNIELSHELSPPHHARRAAERRGPDLPEGRHAAHRPL
jgi:4-amino-4-deoxy-L-arabinose transferase-like glycosyltransferase